MSMPSASATDDARRALRRFASRPTRMPTSVAASATPAASSPHSTASPKAYDAPAAGPRRNALYHGNGFLLAKYARVLPTVVANSGFVTFSQPASIHA